MRSFSKKLILTLVLPALLFGSVTPASAFDTNWTHKAKITISSTHVDSTLTDFPVYVDLSDLDSTFHSNVAANTMATSTDLEASSSQYWSITDASQTGLDLSTTLSIEVVAKLESLPGVINTLVSKYDSGSNDRSYMLIYQNESTDKLRFNASGNGTSAEQEEVDLPAITDAWYHIAVTYDGTAGEVKFYVQGDQQGSTQSTSVSSLYNSGAAFEVGSFESGTFTHDGEIKEVRIWNDVRTAAEIRGNMLETLDGDEAGLVAYYKFEGNGTDETSNNNDLTNNNTATFVADAPFNDGGRDIRVTKSDETTEVEREVVWYDDGTDTGELYFLADSLSSSADTDFYIFFGNSAADDYLTTETYGSENVWSDYVFVGHLQGAMGKLFNSTGKGSLLAYGSPTFEATGKIGDALSLDGSTDYFLGSPTGTNTTEPITLQGWMTQDSRANAWFAGMFGSAGSSQLGIGADNDATLGYINLYAAGGIAESTTETSGTFQLTHGVFAADNDREVYMAGSSEGTNTSSQSVGSTTDFTVGRRYNDQYWNGDLDEVRYTNSELTAAWIDAEYTNQNTPDTFYTIAASESNSASSRRIFFIY